MIFEKLLRVRNYKRPVLDSNKNGKISVVQSDEAGTRRPSILYNLHARMLYGMNILNYIVARRHRVQLPIAV